MLKLRPGTVIEVFDAASAPAADGAAQPEQALVVELEGLSGGDPQRRPAIADVGLVGHAEVGDEVIVNVEALDLELGSGGFDVVHVNLTRGLSGGGGPLADDGAMKLNYTSLQHAVEPVDDETLELPLGRPVAVIALHAQLAPLAWAFSSQAPGMRLGYVQTEGGALPGGHSRTVRELRRRGLLAGHITAGGAFGGEAEAITTGGAIHHGLLQARLGRGRVRPRARDRGVRLRARARRHGGARLGPRVARARLSDAGGRADVLE